MSGKGTTFGAFLDSTLDRLEEAIVVAAVAGYLAPPRARGLRAGGAQRDHRRAADLACPQPARGVTFSLPRSTVSETTWSLARRQPLRSRESERLPRPGHRAPQRTSHS